MSNEKRYRITKISVPKWDIPFLNLNSLGPRDYGFRLEKWDGRKKEYIRIPPAEWEISEV